MHTPRTATFTQLSGRTLYRLLQLRAEVFVVEQECPYADLDGLDPAESTLHLWLAETDEPLAYLRITEEQEYSRIGRVCTRSSHRGRGLASQLLAHALPLLGDKPTVLHAQTHVTGLYRRHGFEISGSEFFEDGIPHVPMRYQRVTR